jgi:hypothetical protein
MSNINKTVRTTAQLNLDILNRAVAGGLLSVLITETEIRFFMPEVIASFVSLPGDKAEALVANLRRKGIPFASEIEYFKPTMKYIPHEHLCGVPVAPKVYPQRAKDATRPVEPKAPPAAPAAAEPAGAPAPESALFGIPGVTPVVQVDETKPAKKARKPRTKKAEEAVG